MAKFWMNDKKSNNPADDFGIDIDSNYYGNIDGGETASFETSDLYGELGGVDSDVQVVAPEDDTLYKVLYAPEDCECRGDVVDSLVAGRVVVINVADLAKEEFLRLFDYVMGALQALGGEMKRYGKKVVALFPAGIDPETPLEEIETEPNEDYEENEEAEDYEEETLED